MKAPIISKEDRIVTGLGDLTSDERWERALKAQCDADHHFYMARIREMRARIREIFEELAKPCYHGKTPLRVGECNPCLRELKARFLEEED